MPANEKRRYVMTSDLRQYIAEYTVANFLLYPIRRRVTYASALEYSFGAPGRLCFMIVAFPGYLHFFCLYPRLTLMLRTLCGSDCISSWVHLFTLPFGGFDMADCSPGNMYFLCISSETIIGLWYRKQFEVFSFVIISEYACFTY